MVTVWDEGKATESRLWIEEMTGERFPFPSPTSADFQKSLKNGVILCKLANAIRPRLIPNINNRSMPFMEMENIGNYINACKSLGLPPEYNFMTVDLYEGKNLSQVVLNVISLRRHLGLGFEKSGKGVPPPKLVEVRGDDQSTSSASAHSSMPTVVSSGPGPASRVGPALKAGVLAPQMGLECQVCLKPITAAVVNACGRVWHPACFSCKKCAVKIGTGKYYEHGGSPYCEKCQYTIKSSPGAGAKTRDMGFKFGKR